MSIKTHLVLDLMYHESEGQSCFAGTEQECNDFVIEQNTVGLKVVHMTKDEYNLYNHKDGAGNSLIDLYPFGLPKPAKDNGDNDAVNYCSNL